MLMLLVRDHTLETTTLDIHRGVLLRQEQLNENSTDVNS